MDLAIPILDKKLDPAPASKLTTDLFGILLAGIVAILAPTFLSHDPVFRFDRDDVDVWLRHGRFLSSTPAAFRRKNRASEEISQSCRQDQLRRGPAGRPTPRRGIELKTCRDGIAIAEGPAAADRCNKLPHLTVHGRSCCKRLFASSIAKFSRRRRGF
jgi:hypothetical protein